MLCVACKGAEICCMVLPLALDHPLPSLTQVMVMLCWSILMRITVPLHFHLWLHCKWWYFDCIKQESNIFRGYHCMTLEHLQDSCYSCCNKGNWYMNECSACLFPWALVPSLPLRQNRYWLMNLVTHDHNSMGRHSCHTVETSCISAKSLAKGKLCLLN